MKWIILLFSGAICIKGLIQLHSPTDFFIKLFFMGLEEDKYTYDRKLFRIIDVCTSLLVSITLLVVYFTHYYWLLLLVGIYTVILVFVTDAFVRKEKIVQDKPELSNNSTKRYCEYCENEKSSD